MRQTKLILLLPIIGILEVVLFAENTHQLMGYIYMETALICICGYLGVKRDMWILLSLFYLWVFISNLYISFSLEAASIEAVILGMLVYWIYQRPERIPSDPPSETVQIAFYYGNKSPFIARIMSLIGLPVSGIGIIIWDEAIVPVGKAGKLQKRRREALKSWVKLDTKIMPKERDLTLFHSLEGQFVEHLGCMKAFYPFLNNLGIKPTIDPSSYMSKILNLRTSFSSA